MGRVHTANRSRRHDAKERKNVCACERRRVCGGVQKGFSFASWIVSLWAQASGGADGRETVRGSVLERLEGGVGLQRLGDVLGALCTELVVTQTAIESKTQTSGGADTFVRKRTHGGNQAGGSVLELSEG